MPHAVRVIWPPRAVRSVVGEGSAFMADLAYALLLVGVFLVLALMVRGLEKL
ncbi:hypothetical protein [Saccharothrix deserti]|uniref:hypothetical protein n=1 Tax=Saccharothrix deserti TaxID=2593674 RepID=UPI00131B6E7D|nr:hypothetical protein [Saccharothrix deserti]